MNYRHSYHAGGFSDVFKHCVLIALLQSLNQKPKPYCYIETHAGRGKYDLNSEPAQKTKEYIQGIVQLFNAFAEQGGPNLVQDYLKIVQEAGYPEYYPGSPLIAKALMRTSDRRIVAELNPEEVQLLKDLFKGDKATIIHHQSGYITLNAVLPPQERRGLILIDPPFEKESEWPDIVQALTLSIKKFNTGIYCIWYPVKDKKIIQKYQEKIRQTLDLELLVGELKLFPEDFRLGLGATGIMVLNPPWQFDNTLAKLITYLEQSLAQR